MDQLCGISEEWERRRDRQLKKQIYCLCWAVRENQNLNQGTKMIIYLKNTCCGYN